MTKTVPLRTIFTRMIVLHLIVKQLFQRDRSLRIGLRIAMKVGCEVEPVSSTFFILASSWTNCRQFSDRPGNGSKNYPQENKAISSPN